MKDKEQPRDLDSEEAVLGSLLIDGELIKSVRLEPSDFFYEQNQLIFKAMLTLKEKGEKVNQLTVAQRLHAQGKLETIGGASHLSHLISICPTSLDCDSYAEIVRRLSTSRNLITASEKIASLGYEASPDTAETLSKADSILLKLRQKAGGSFLITPENRGEILLDRYTAIYDNEKKIAVATRLADLDKFLGGGLFPTETTILSARTSVGKSTMVRFIANNIAEDRNVLFVSTEMSEGGLSDRDLAGVMGKPISYVRAGHFSFDEYCDIVAMIPYIGERKLYSMDNTWGGRIDTASVYQTGYELANRVGLSLIVIDHINKLSDVYGHNEDERTGYIMRQLTQMAGSLNVPLLGVAHMNRAAEGRENKRPVLSDLRNSGNIENDADNVIFLYRENYYDKQSTSKEVEVIIAKQRQGGVGTVNVIFDDIHHTYFGVTKDGQEERLI
uniref:DNA 5'-3' helicase n=1 Tax=viral metagenome TaxID=1070528 RepID=A0A6M3J332_9ZZZZ